MTDRTIDGDYTSLCIIAVNATSWSASPVPRYLLAHDLEHRVGMGLQLGQLLVTHVSVSSSSTFTVPSAFTLMLAGLQLAVDDAALVGRPEGLGDLLGDGKGFVDRDGAVLDAICQRRAFDQFENQRLDALSLFQPVNAPDVRMVQRGKHLGLPLEAGQPVGSDVNASGSTASTTFRSSVVSRV